MTITARFSSQKFAAGATKNSSPCPRPPTGKRPSLKVRRVGLVSRNYWNKLPNKIDFSGVLRKVLSKLEEKKCDTVLLSLWSIILPFSVKEHLSAMRLRHIKVVLYEEFALNGKISERDLRKLRKFPEKPNSSRFVVCYRKNGVWREYKFNGVFGSLNPRKRDREEAKAAGLKIKEWMRGKANCLVNQMPIRTMGNCCVLICGESNIVRRRRRREDKEVKIYDESQIKRAMRENLRIVLNPGHDRMGPRMNLKREFLSERPTRWVLSVWNKGKRGKHGKERDGKKPAWMVFNGGRKIKTIKQLGNLPNGLEAGVVDCR